MHRIAVFSGDLSYSVRKGIVDLDRRIPGIDWLIVRQVPRKTIRQLAHNQWRNLRKNGWRWIIYQGSEIACALWHRLADREVETPAIAPGVEYALASLAAQANVRVFETPDINGKDAIAEVASFAPDLGLSLAAPILRNGLFELPRLGTVNLHKGRLPDYRGMPPAFWELWNGEPEIGCTVHRVNAGLDKGEIVEETTVPVRRYSTVKGLQLTLDEAGIALMTEAVEKIFAGAATSRAQPQGGKTYTKPTLKQIAQLSRRLSLRLPDRPGRGRAFIKNVYLLGCAFIVRPLASLLSRKPTIIVVLYHRISDDLRDSLTTGIEQFDRQLALIRKHCRVLSIDDVICGRFPARSIKPLVCVTFDDGYEDNYSAAVPLLRRHQIPAAFFVSTGFIDSKRSFPHDEGKRSSPLPNMTWDNLREMKQHGFVIGSHTVNHIDCALESRETVQVELHASLAKLRSELGLHSDQYLYSWS